MDILERSLTYEEVTEIFVRVNSLGAKLRSSDLALAQITAKWPHSLKIFQDFHTRCAEAGFELDLGLHIKLLVAFATGQSRFRIVANLSPDSLQSAWKEACQGMEFAINFLKENVVIDSRALLSSPFILITVSMFGKHQGYELTPEQAKLLRFWILAANGKGRYSRGSSETILDQDLSSVLRGGGVTELVDRLTLQVGRLDINPAELEGRNQRSALFKTMFLAFRSEGATDWRSNITISLDHSGRQHRLQFHHIFPKAMLKDIATDREADDIANLAFVAGGTNRRISAMGPAEYIPPLIEKGGEGPFSAQAIPIDPMYLNPDAYKAFLSERRKRIAQMLNRFLDTEVLVAEDDEREHSATSASLDELIKTGEGGGTEFKETLRVNTHTGQTDARIEHAVLKTIAGFVNNGGGTLIVGINDQGEAIGIGTDRFPSEDKMNLHLVNLIRDRIGAQHMMFIKLRFEALKNARVLVVNCKKGRTPVYVKDGNVDRFYVRTGSATTELSGYQMQEFIIKTRFR